MILDARTVGSILYTVRRGRGVHEEVVESVEVGDGLRSEGFMHLNVVYNVYGLQVRVNGVSHMSNISMPDWSPKVDWHLGCYLITLYHLT